MRGVYAAGAGGPGNGADAHTLGVEIVTVPGEVPLAAAELRLAQALTFHHKYGAAAIVHASTKIADTQGENDPDAIVIWSEIAEELKTIRYEALRAERGGR